MSLVSDTGDLLFTFEAFFLKTSSLIFLCSAAFVVPAAVQSLVLAGQGTEDLRVRWSAAPGDVDHYEVQLLFNDLKVFPPITLGSSKVQCVLPSLTPGRLYKILVSTFSGPNQRAQFVEGRTGEESTAVERKKTDYH